MKRHLVVILFLSFSFCIYAQDNDSILLERTDMLKKEILTLKKKSKSLQAQIYNLQQAHKADNEAVKEEFSAMSGDLKEVNATLSELEEAVRQTEKSSLEGLTMLGDWTKKTLMILAIVLAVLFIILLILVISNRSRIQKDFLKLEAKVDNTREALEREVKEVLRKHEEDIGDLKAQIEKGKK